MSDVAPVVVIGGSRGTGRLIAERFHQQGRHVRVMTRDPDRLRPEFDPAIALVTGDLTQPGSLDAALGGAGDIVFTAGVPSGRYAPESLVRATDHDGVLHTLAAARRAGFGGRFVYLNSIGVAVPSFAAWALNLLKRNTLVWRRKVEPEIRASGIAYTIIRVGFLTNAPGGHRAIRVGQDALSLAPRHRIARADVAEVFATALTHPRAAGATFEIVWEQGPPRESVAAALDRLRPDSRPREGGGNP